MLIDLFKKTIILLSPETLDQLNLKLLHVNLMTVESLLQTHFYVLKVNPLKEKMNRLESESVLLSALLRL